MRLFLTIISLTTAILLTGCSREPTEPELRQAYEKSLAEANQLAVKIGGDRMKIGLQDFKKLSCEQPEASANQNNQSQQESNNTKQYRCDIQVKLDLPLVGPSTQNGTMTVVKHDRGWVVLSNN
ncbi:hypothetical protein [Alkanindiges illinoisensis]|uniref:Lipoprotein n=1 Tax=Alkanindiges illinoisensis TaxID=197183 RepID=A0A4Y7XD90_9GAMM|nr:hypothetical protein [Alkanindiges illinoisensis]TEU28575.1 hypothetical protein E2B99_05525 [Alkanindiges illinoisensis]